MRMTQGRIGRRNLASWCWNCGHGETNLVVISVLRYYLSKVVLPKIVMIAYLHKRESNHRQKSGEECERVNSADSRLLAPGQVNHVAHPGGAGDQEDWGKRTQLVVTRQSNYWNTQFLVLIPVRPSQKLPMAISQEPKEVS